MHDRVGEVLEPLGQADIADEVFAAALVDEAAAGVGAEARDRLLDLLMRDVERLHGGDVRRHPVLAHFAADRDHLGDAAERQKLRADDEVGDLAHLHRRGAAVAGQRHQHDLAHDRGDRAHLRIEAARKLLADQREPLGHELPRAVDVGAPVEFHIDDRQADAGHRAHPDHARHAVHRGLDRIGDELLDLLRRQAFGLGEQRHRRAVEVGKHVDRDARQHEGAVAHEDERRRQHEQPVAQARRDQDVEHGPAP